MRRCIIFCAGDCIGPARPFNPEDIVIAADGGLAHLQRLSIKPNIILGDFDSLGYTPEGAEVFPVEKDDTDSMLAIKQGLAMGCDRFDLYGALDGTRVDHTMANFQALAFLAQRGCRGYLMGCRQIATAIHNETITLPAEFTGYLSVFCMGADAEGVTIRGAQYQLENAILTSGFPLGVSNRFTGKSCTISVESGTLLLIWDRHNGTI